MAIDRMAERPYYACNVKELDLAAELEKAGITRLEFAQMLGRSERTVYRLLTGEKKMDALYAAAIRATLGSRSTAVVPHPARRSKAK